MTRIKFNPHVYQGQIISHQVDTPRGATHAGMGTGKTVATLSAIDLLQLSGDLKTPALILAPLRVAQSTWPDEAEKWEHLSGMQVTPIIGDAATRHRLLFGELKRGNSSVFTINYDNAEWLNDALAKAGLGWPFEMVVSDESTRLKSFRTRQGGARAKALSKFAHTKVKRWVNLTGTPAPNGLKDLWGPMWFVDGGERLGRSYTAYTDRWFKKGYDGYGLEPMPYAQEAIQDKIRDVTLTVTGLPVDKPIVNPIYVELPKAARDIYREMEKRMYAEVEGLGVEAPNAAARTMKCLQIASGFMHAEDNNEKVWKEIHEAKFSALESIIEEAAGMPVLVSYHWVPTLLRLKKRFPKLRHLDKDPQTMRDWNAGHIPVLAAHPASAGHGISLQDGGNILARFDWWWDFEQYDQIMERIGPMRQKQSGYNRPVYEHHILMRGTVDETVLARHQTKRSVQSLLMEAMKRHDH